MKTGVCGIACEICPKMSAGTCPNGEAGCLPRNNKFCKICTCAFERGIRHCFKCPQFPCELTSGGPISPGFCGYISGKSS